jgi:cytochrome c553
MTCHRRGGTRESSAGYPRLAASSERARDTEARLRPSRDSERLTGASYPV